MDRPTDNATDMRDAIAALLYGWEPDGDVLRGWYPVGHDGASAVGDAVYQHGGRYRITVEKKVGDARDREAPAGVEGGMWAVVEVLGHKRHVGRVSTDTELLATGLLRIDTPAHTLTWVDRWDQRGRTEGLGFRPVELQQDYAPSAVYVGSAAIFRITPTPEAACMAELAGNGGDPIDYNLEPTDDPI